MNCPKCGFQQKEGPECLRCGVVFARYAAAPEFRPPRMHPAGDSAEKPQGTFRKIYRLLRWAVPALLLIVLVLMLRSSPPPHVASNPEAAKRAQAKIEEFQSSLGTGTEQQLSMDESELNGWLHENLALKGTSDSRPAEAPNSETILELAKTANGTSAAGREALEQMQSNVHDVQIELLDNSLRIYAVFDFHGMDLTMELEGQPVVQDGYIRLEPSGGKLGSLPLLAGALKNATDRLFSSPENREKFKLPPQIQDVRVEQGRLLILSR